MEGTAGCMCPNTLRFPVEPRDVPPIKIARRLGITLAQFEECKDRLFARLFPRPDPTTGNYDLRAVDAWMDARSGLDATDLTAQSKPRNAQEVFGERRASLGTR